MEIRIDTTDTDYAAPARHLLGILDDSSYYSLAVVFGADLCVLGGTKHPFCWEPLKNAWHQLGEDERERISASRVQTMLNRGLIAALPSDPGSHPRYVLGDDLRILLAAREFPAFTIVTHHEPRTPDVTYFQPSGTSAIVQEIPERSGRHWPRQPRSPLDVIFSYRFSNQAFAARELARWALKPVLADRGRPKPPRLICFSGPTEAGRHASYQLVVHRDGKEGPRRRPGHLRRLHPPRVGRLSDRYRHQVGRHPQLPRRPGRQRGQQRARPGTPVTGATTRHGLPLPLRRDEFHGRHPGEPGPLTLPPDTQPRADNRRNLSRGSLLPR